MDDPTSQNLGQKLQNSPPPLLQSPIPSPILLPLLRFRSSRHRVMRLQALQLETLHQTLDPDPPARLHDGAHSKRPCLADRATSSFSIDAILDMSKLSLFDDDKVLSLSAARKRWFARKRRRRGGSRSTQLERHENSMLRSKNDKLRAGNMSIREAMRNPMCTNCGGPAVLGEISLEEQHLRIENARLKDELDHVCALAGKFLGRPISSLAPPTPNSRLELGVGTNGFGLNPTLPLVPSDFNVGISSPPKSTMNVIPIEKSYERSMYLELALTEPAPIYLWRPEGRIRAGWAWFLLGTIAQLAVVT
ncbi:hypothetical protein CASFOL_021346 [Castilleja foliolosa]|uniref:BZIP domain-containing protein n=1 Tax=Castilleja foliolosa TaxID=1961234 RepID=A0ABD3D0F5_9LAMI